MGAYSTVDVTRDTAIKAIINCLFDATDEQIEEILFSLYGDQRLNNYNIVCDYENSKYTFENPYGFEE